MSTVYPKIEETKNNFSHAKIQPCQTRECHKMYPNSNKVQKVEISTVFEFFQGGCIASLDQVLAP